MGGTLVTAHCYTAEGVRHAIAGGVRGIEHGNMIDPATAKLMADVGCFLTPTLALHTFVTMPPYDKFETPVGLAKNAIVGQAGIKAIRYAEDAGVCVCFGTDTTGPTLVMQTYEVSDSKFPAEDVANTVASLLCVLLCSLRQSYCAKQRSMAQSSSTWRVFSAK